MDTNIPYHIPALLKPTIDLLVVNPDGVYVDCTMGGAGHTRAILDRLSPKGRLFAFDQDSDAQANIPDDPRVTFVNANFRYLYNFLRFYGVDKVDGILADLGVSFHHFDDGERGFSFREDAPLDMRMNRNSQFTAADYLASMDEEGLRDALREYTDLNKIATITNAILDARKKAPITTTGELVAALEPVLNPKGFNPKNFKKDLAQVFQMLRIMVNGEFSALKELLEQSNYLLKVGGRLAILSYHSGEDRIIKNFIQNGTTGPANSLHNDIYGKSSAAWKRITRSPITADTEEVETNPRARSAKLRVAERMED